MDFVKMHGLGNDFILIDLYDQPGAQDDALKARELELELGSDLGHLGAEEPALPDRHGPVRAHGQQAEPPLAVDHELHVVPVAPGIGHADHRPHRRVWDAAKPLKLIADDLFLVAELGVVGDVLPLTATAQSKALARRGHALGGWDEHANKAGEGVAPPVLHDVDEHLLAGDAAGDEDGLAMVAPDCGTVVGHVVEDELYAAGRSVR